MKQFLMLGNETSQVILSLSLMLFAGFLVTRVTKRLKLPNVTGYIFAGILLGPYLLDTVPVEVASGMGFVTDIALAYIAFGVGRYFKIATLKKSGGGTLIITVLEALLAMAAITLPMIFLFHLPVPFSLLLGAIGCATAPASTIMTIRQYHAKGPFVNLILQVVALDDAVALVAFSVCTAVTQALEGGGKVNAMDVAAPVLWNLGAVVLGIGLGWVLHRLISERRSSDHRLVIANGVILGMTGLCTLLNISPLLSCMALGASYINLSGNKHLFKEINRFTPPVLLLFFVISGMRLNIPALATAGVIGVAYFFLRIAGKYAGAFAGCALCRMPGRIRNWLGLALIPQAGVSIGLAALGERMLPPETGALLSAIILSSAVLYETVGPACAKASLFLSHTLEQEEKPGGAGPKPRDEVQGQPEEGKPVVRGHGRIRKLALRMLQAVHH